MIKGQTKSWTIILSRHIYMYMYSEAGTTRKELAPLADLQSTIPVV